MRGKFVFVLACLLVLAAVLAFASGCGKKEQPAGGEPTVSFITPDTGPAGTQLTVVGEKFGAAQGDGAVQVGKELATVVSWSDVEIAAKVSADLAVAEYGVMVITDAGESKEVPFTVTKSSAPDRKGGDIEHVTPIQAMTDYEAKKGVSTEGMTFSVVKESTADPKWKIDKASKPGFGAIFFLLHEENGNWVVKDDGSQLTPQELQAEGAPSDLWNTPQTETQAEAVWSYMRAQGVDPAAYSISVTRTSTIDPNWEMGLAQKPGAQSQQIVFHKENGNWVVKGMSPGYTSDQLAQMGVPRDLIHTATEAQAISSWMTAGNAPPGVTAAGWQLQVVKVSRIDPDWEIVKGVQAPGAGTMFFVLHWENNQWVVKDDGGTQTSQDLNTPGMPTDLP